MTTPSISVIIPTYNNTKTIRATILSCLNQTLPPLEILICDDGSTDDTKSVVEDIKDNRILWIPNKHSGKPATPRNNGLNLIKGEWVAFCDSDDQWLPTKLEDQINLCSKLNLKASCTNGLRKINDIIGTEKMINSKRNSFSFCNLLHTNNIICSSTLVHSSILKDVGKFPEENIYKSFEDYIYWLKISTKTSFAFVDKSLIIYDDHPTTSVRKDSPPGEVVRQLSLTYVLKWLSSQQNSFIKKIKYKKYIGYYLLRKKIISLVK